jgi:hypothetical protein
VNIAKDGGQQINVVGDLVKNGPVNEIPEKKSMN